MSRMNIQKYAILIYSLFIITINSVFTLRFKLQRTSSLVNKINYLSNTKLALTLNDFPTSSTPIDILSTPESQNIVDSVNLSGISIFDVQNIAIVLSGVGYYLYEKRPRGSCRKDLIDVRRSNKIQNNLGVYATQFIPKGTVIGTYPGYIKTTEEFLNSKSSKEALQLAKKYVWQVSDDQIIDPTDENGLVGLEISYLSGIIKISTTLARLNEPPIGLDCTVYTREINGNVEIITEKDIFPNEELFIDYGTTFDRTDYAKEIEDEEEEMKRRENILKLEKLRREEDMMQLQPIVTDDDKTIPIDQDTSISDGFISKLVKQEQKYKKSGILSPEEALKLFYEKGENMFASAEDQELIDSITGKSSTSSTPKPSSSNNNNNNNNNNKEKSNSLNDDNDLMNSLFGKSAKDLFNDFGENTPTSTSTSTSKFQETSSPPPTPAKLAEEETAIFEDDRKPLLSQEEANELQSKLDNMTDAQVEKVFENLRKTLGSKLQNQLKDSIDNKSKKGMPKTAPLDPKIREKYDKELKQIEDELDKLYSDPIGVWQNLMKNNDNNDDNNKGLDDLTEDLLK